jgi:predicted oxidoreductase
LSPGHHQRLRIRLSCSNPVCGARFDALTEPSGDTAVTCPACRSSRELDTARAAATGVLTACPCCGGDELYVRKDFPQRLGVAMVVLVGAVSLWLFGRGDLVWAMGVLAGLVVVDLVIYQFVPKITVCYRCKAEFRGLPVNPQHAGFDLATAEKYR